MSWRNQPAVPSLPRVLLADRSPLYCEGLKLALGEGADACVAVDHFDAIEPILAACSHLELLVLDVHLSGLTTLAQLGPLLVTHPLPVMLLADAADDSLFAAGIQGVVSKRSPLPVLSEALLTVREGGYWLPDRTASEPGAPSALVRTLPRLSRGERRVLRLLAAGLPNRAIGERLCISENTVKSHVAQIYRKLQFDNRTLLATAIQALPHTPLVGADPICHGAGLALNPRR